MKRLMYVDADAVVIDSLRELSQWKLGDKALGAVTELTFFDRAEETIAEHWRHIGAVGNSYFNAGMLLIDMDKWHEMRISERAFELIQSNPDRWRISQDQDVLNALYMGRVCWLPGHYNLHCQDGGNQEIPEGTVIVHYAATPKPWSKCCQNLASPWRRIAAASEWRDVPFDASRVPRAITAS